MLDYLHYPIYMVLSVVALMSGILSLARELLQIYRKPQIPQRPIFWKFVIIAFILSAASLWVIDHKQLNTTKAALV
jgi:hypothetical protein